MTVPGIGPLISSAVVAAIGTGDVFSKGRDDLFGSQTPGINDKIRPPQCSIVVLHRQ
jgi:hypothetical protein